MKDEGFIPLWFNILNKQFDTVGGYQFSSGTNFNIEIEFLNDQPGLMFYSGCGVEKELRVEKTLKLP
jgi:hypothetical protein